MQPLINQSNVGPSPEWLAKTAKISALEQQAEKYFKLGKLKQAEFAIRQAILARAPLDAWADEYELLGRILVAQGRKKEAYEVMRRSVFGKKGNRIESPDAFVTLAEEQGKNAESLDFYKKAILTTRNNQINLDLLARKTTDLKKIKALAYIAIATGNAHYSLLSDQQWVDKALALDNHLGVAHFLKAQYLRRRNPPLAKAHVAKAIQYGDSVTQGLARHLGSSIWIPSQEIRERVISERAGCNRQSS
jgi:tetratricopeptide (TPR) repeat protein